MQVARDGPVEWLQTVLERKKDKIKTLDKEGFAAFHYAVMYHRIDIIKKLIEAKCSKSALNIAIPC